MDTGGSQVVNLHDDEVPPFAIMEQKVPQHLFVNRKEEFRSCDEGTSEFKKTTLKLPTSIMLDSQISTTSSPPGLCESALSSSSMSDSSFHANCPSGTSQNFNPSSTFLLNSLPTVVSTMGESSHLPHSHAFENHDLAAVRTEPGAESMDRASRGSIGFSQLMQAADDTNEPTTPLRQSRMPIVPEDEPVSNQSLQSAPSLGTLITSIPKLEDRRKGQLTSPAAPGWLPDFLGKIQPQQLDPLASSMSAPLLSYSPSSNTALDQARSQIVADIIDDECFEVSMGVDTSASIQDIVGVIANPDLLRLWCDPIEALVITSSSAGAQEATRQTDGNKDREYEGEWIEATTGSLISPPSNGGCLYSAGRAALETFGFASYGKLSMFVERRRGQVGLTVGPFSGGISASHTISVHEEDGRARVVDRVRLNKDIDDESVYPSLFLCGIVDSLNRCLLPTVGGYMEQVTTSMARLQLLVKNGQNVCQTQTMGGRDDYDLDDSGLVIQGGC